MTPDNARIWLIENQQPWTQAPDETRQEFELRYLEWLAGGGDLACEALWDEKHDARAL